MPGRRNNKDVCFAVCSVLQVGEGCVRGGVVFNESGVAGQVINLCFDALVVGSV